MNLPAPRSTFVSVIAWLGILFGGLGVLVGLLQLVMLTVMFREGPWAELHEMQMQGMPPVFAWMFRHFHLLVGANMAAMALLLTASIGLLRRRNWARLTMIALLAIAIVANLAGPGMQFYMMQSMAASMGGDGAPPEFTAQFEAMRTMIFVFGLVVAVGFSVLYGWIIRRLASPAVRDEFGG